MCRLGWTLVLSSLVSLFFAAPARAQGQGAIELGVDAAGSLTIFDSQEGNFGLTVDTPNLLVITVPRPMLRVGFFLSEAVQFEPSISIQVASQEEDTITAVDFGLSAVYNLPQEDTSKTMPFLKFGILLDYSSISSGDTTDSNTNIGFGAGIGTRLLISERLRTRFELGGARFMEDPGSWQLYASMGLSFYTK